MKTFWSAQDIEELAAQGKTELIVDENTVLTDLARHTAQQVGISLVSRSGAAPAAAPLASSPISRPAPRAAGVGMANKPKGCQHRPLARSQSPEAMAVSNNNSTTVVDQLVGLVKRLGGKGSAN
ncbi:MAG: hypothetical protein AB1801_01315 [Chloroflexota bacterium]